MLSHRAGRRRDSNSSSGTSTFGTFDSGRPQSFKSSGMSCVRYRTVEGESVGELNERPVFQARVPEPANFTESELRAGTPKKFKSENMAAPEAKRWRRALSDYHDPLTVISKGNTEHLSCRCPCHGCPNVQLCGSSVKSSSTAISWWGAESSAKALANEHSKRSSPDFMLTRSQLARPCEHALPIVPDRRARTCETFMVHSVGPQPNVTRRRIICPVARRTPRTPLIFSRCPASGDEPDHRRSVGARRRLPNRGARSAIAAPSPPQVSSFLTRSSTPRSGYGSAGRSGDSRSRRSSARGEFTHWSCVSSCSRRPKGRPGGAFQPWRADLRLGA
ncbi:hypothetical protein MTO96_010903 [Rhipicephalus appendiculatus]